MLKLISLNIETNKHYHRVLALLNKENPDVMCFQEVPKEFLSHIERLGYETCFVTRRTIFDENGDSFEEGLLLASRFPFEAETKLYHKEKILVQNPSLVRSDNSTDTRFDDYSYIIAKIFVDDKIFNIATTHLMVTADGLANEFQAKGVAELLNQLESEDSHIICGDFNMPRGYNSLYNEFTKYYTDQIPLKYKSSLDRNLHRCGNMQLNQPIFDEYMVDYVFTKLPYQARNVRLEFGVSDHAAVIAEIYQ